jgi:hypothetical protein
MAKKEDVKFYMGNQNLPSKGSSFAYTPDQITELEKCSKNTGFHLLFVAFIYQILVVQCLSESMTTQLPTKIFLISKT